MEVQSEEVLNGWNLEAFRETVATVESNPEAGRLTWRGRVSCDGSFGVDARAEEIEQLGEVIPRRFILRGDHPPELLGDNTGPTAVETLLSARASQGPTPRMPPRALCTSTALRSPSRARST